MSSRFVLVALLLLALAASAYGAPLLGASRIASFGVANRDSRKGLPPSERVCAVVAAVMPGDPVISGTLSLGVMNGISIFTYILYARFALSWFPQLPRQFPVLRPINTVTEPYLKIFRQVIPPIGGFDLSALPAIFLLDIFSQTVAAIGDSRSFDAKALGVWSNKKQRALEARMKKLKQQHNIVVHSK